MLDSHRDRFLKLELLLAGIFEKLPFPPSAYTLLSLLLAAAGSVVLAKQLYPAAGALFLVAFALDLVDGAVARAKNLSSKKGAYLDTIVDRYIEAFLLLGLIFIPLPVFFLTGPVWIFLVLLGSIMTTYAKAAAKEKGLSDTELRGGLMSRAERAIVLFLVLVLLQLGYDLAAVYLLALLALLVNVTAIQRIVNALNK